MDLWLQIEFGTWKQGDLSGVEHSFPIPAFALYIINRWSAETYFYYTLPGWHWPFTARKPYSQAQTERSSHIEYLTKHGSSGLHLFPRPNNRLFKFIFNKSQVKRQTWVTLFIYVYIICITFTPPVWTMSVCYQPTVIIWYAGIVVQLLLIQ